MNSEVSDNYDEFIMEDEAEDYGSSPFDRDVTFGEVFHGSLGKDFVNWLSELINRDFLIVGGKGESVMINAGGGRKIEMPRLPEGALPRKPVRIRGLNGVGAVGIPVIHEGDTFALLVVEEEVLSDKVLFGKFKIVANLVSWYVHVIYQQRMISELHDTAQKANYEELVKEHKRVLESEKRYRELAENLERRVQERRKELEKAQKQLLQQEKMASIGQLAAGVAHEINNPTGFVNSNLQTLRKYHDKMIDVLTQCRAYFEKIKGPGSERFIQYWKQLDIDYVLEDLPVLVDESLKGTERIIKIVRGLSRFSHVDHDEWEHININELLDSAVELLWNEIKHKAELIKDYGDVPEIRGNPNRLSQVFVNLIINAVHAIEKDGKIWISTKVCDDRLEIRIKDNGKGIPPENIDRIYNPFYTTKPVGQGTGLGLSISYEIITGHNGEINVESELWQGTTFTIRLPIESERGD